MDNAILIGGKVYTSAANVADWLDKMAKSAVNNGWDDDASVALRLCANEWRKWALDNEHLPC